MSSVVFMLYFWTCTTYRYHMTCEWQHNQTFVSEQECKQMGAMLGQRKVKPDGQALQDQNREHRCVRKTN